MWVSALTFHTVLVSLLRSEYLSLLEVIFTIDLTHKVHEQVIGMKTIFLLTRLSAFYEYCESPRAKRTRQSRDWVLNETNIATDY